MVATSNVGADEVADAVGNRFGEETEVHVVAPASGLSRLDWLTNAEDAAREEAANRAAEVADALPEAVDGGVGDVDPLQAIEDAIRMFSPNHVVLVTRGDDEANWLEGGAGEAARNHFDVPVTHLVLS